MMSVPVRVLTQYLLDKTDFVLSKVDVYKTLSFEQLCQQPSKNSWSIAECLYHLNLYGAYYLPQITSSFIPENEWKSLDTTFKSGYLGSYMASMMLPDNGKPIKKIKTPSNKNPKLIKISKDIIDEFISQQKVYKEIILISGQSDLVFYLLCALI
jgi:DinB superfamily